MLSRREVSFKNSQENWVYGNSDDDVDELVGKKRCVEDVRCWIVDWRLFQDV